MYCSSCGVAVTQNLTYCNHCGARINSGKADANLKTTELRFDAMIMSAMVALFIFGLPAISVLIGVMKDILHFEYGPLVAFALLSFLILVGIEGVLILRLFRRKRNADDAARILSREGRVQAIAMLKTPREAWDPGTSPKNLKLNHGLSTSRLAAL